jgi:hypothetical protein
LEDEIFVEVFGVGEKATEAYERVLRCTPKAFDAGSQRRASTMRWRYREDKSSIEARGRRA